MTHLQNLIRFQTERRMSAKEAPMRIRKILEQKNSIKQVSPALLRACRALEIPFKIINGGK